MFIFKLSFHQISSIILENDISLYYHFFHISLTAFSKNILKFVCFFKSNVALNTELTMRKAIIMISLFLLILSYGNIESADNRSASKGKIIVKIENFEHSNGVLRSHLYNIDKKQFFPTKTDFCFKRDTALINDNKSLIIYDDLPFGVYALTVHHDENANGTMDTNFLGLPVEGFGISMNPTIIMSVPEFEEAQFDLNDKEKKIVVKMKY